MIIYCNTISSRLIYIIHTLFGNNTTITCNKEEYLASTQTKINYSHYSIIENECWIKPTNLLFEKSIINQEIEISSWENLPVFFLTDGKIPFDIFAASFYLISRYEEYLPHQKDMYNRYAHQNSIAYKNNFLHLPLVNLWLQKLTHKYAEIKLPHTVFNYIPTYDIDIAYCYKHKSLIQNIGAFLKNLFKANLYHLKENILVNIGYKNDPFDVYTDLFKIHSNLKLQPIYFFLLAQKRKGYDKNLNPNKNAIKQLIQIHSSEYPNQMGIHPSYQSNFNTGILQNEIEILEKHSSSDINKSRQHYIKISLPTTYNILLEKSITQDFSMGYGSINGFRASYTNPFYWFNLNKNETTNLLITPFCYMDANSFFEQKYTVQQATDELEQYLNIVKNVKGTLVTVFHNHFITKQPQWIKWREMYFNFLTKNFF
jgi:hypothetical protein